MLPSFTHPRVVPKLYDFLFIQNTQKMDEWMEGGREGRMDGQTVWCCFGPHWLSYYEHKQLKHSSK